MTSESEVGTRPSGPVAAGQRYLAPDLARGAMLLFIALANSHTFLSGGTTIRGYPVEGGFLDHVAAGVLTTFVDGRAYPMFALLFGYGMVQVLRRQEDSGHSWESSRRLLRRRGRWLLVFGILHAVLLWVGDVMGAYGLVALIFVVCLKTRDGRLLVYAGIWMLVGSLFYVLMSMPTGSSLGQLYADPVEGMVGRGVAYAIMLPLLALPAVCPFLLGVWAARRRILEEPHAWQGFLRRTAVLGLSLAVVGGLPLALVTAQVWRVESPELIGALGSLHAAAGFAGGAGYAAAIALVALRIGERPGPLVTAVAAVGQRSMTCYVAQSVVWMGAFAMFLGNLGSRIGPAATVVLAVVTWLLTILMAESMRRKGIRGPLETLMRRLVYRSG